MSRFINAISKSDIRLFYVINKRVKCKLLDKVMPVITNLAGPLVVIPITLFLYILSKENMLLRRMALESMLSLSCSHLVVQALKHAVSRERPGYVLDDVYTFKDFYDYSFPSGHTTAAFSMAISTFLFYQSVGMLLIFVAFMVGISRMYIGVHYPSDVFIGAILGTIFPFVIHSILT